jgi:hypothetical protein
VLDEQSYRTKTTGLPQGIVYEVQNSTTGQTFEFSGGADGKLVYTVASLEGRDLVPGEEPPQAGPVDPGPCAPERASAERNDDGRASPGGFIRYYGLRGQGLAP